MTASIPPIAIFGDTVRVQAHSEPRRAALNVEALYRRYGDLVLGRCRTLLRNEADAQEVCQEVFLRLHRYRSSFRGDAAPSTYLFRIATTASLNRLRYRRRHPEDPVEDFPMVAAQDSLLDATEIKDLLDRVLAEADSGTVDALIYHFVDGMTYAEVGEILGVTGGAVRKRIGVFRKRLAQSPPAWLDEVES
ncbi:MAG: RNA polymerase sigma factor [Proteobacteria bacterium]|nr:RNA polymerase sigma factor [Pseudomonadota bacterium]